MTVDDAIVIEAVNRGSEEALGSLYRRYWPMAWHWAYAMTGQRHAADDYAQEAMLRAIRALPRFDTQRPFAPWLKRILVNLVVDDIRRTRQLRTRELEGWMDESRRDTSGSDEALTAVISAVGELAPTRRMVIVLHYWLDLTVEEIASALDLPYGTVASRLSRALSDLRAALAEEERYV